MKKKQEKRKGKRGDSSRLKAGYQGRGLSVVKNQNAAREARGQISLIESSANWRKG